MTDASRVDAPVTDIGVDLPALRRGVHGDDASRRVHRLLRMHRMRRDIEAQARRLLRILFVWLGAVSADPGGPRQYRCRVLPVRRRFRLLLRGHRSNPTCFGSPYRHSAENARDDMNQRIADMR